METYSFKEIGDTIYTKMLEIKDTQWNVWVVWEVYNYDIKIEWWISLPAIIITPTNGNSSYLDTCNNQDIIRYNVRLIDRIQDWIAEVEDNMRKVADIMMSKLKEIWTISWTNNNWYTVKCEFDYTRWFIDTQEPFRVFEVECSFTTLSK